MVMLKTKQISILAFAILAVGLFLGVGVGRSNAATGINKELSYYGVLKSAGGTTVADGNQNMVFKIYTVASGGTPVWTGNDCRFLFRR